MILPENYEIMFSDWSKVQPLWVRKKTETGTEDIFVVSTDNDDNYVDLSGKEFKALLGQDGEHLTAVKVVDGVESHINILLKAGSPTGELLLGKKIEEMVASVKAPKRTAKKKEVKEEEVIE